MEGNIQSALVISAIGMAIVFGVILILWALMALVVRVAAGRPEEEGVKPVHEPDGTAIKARAAAAAVAAYLAAERRAPQADRLDNGA